MREHEEVVARELADFLSVYRLAQGLRVGSADELSRPYADKLVGLYGGRVVDVEADVGAGRGRSEAPELKAEVDALFSLCEKAPSAEELEALARVLLPAGVVTFLMGGEWDTGNLSEKWKAAIGWSWEVGGSGVVYAWPLPIEAGAEECFGVRSERTIYERLLPASYMFPYGRWSLLVGRSGFGKTTLVQLASGVLRLRAVKQVNPPAAVFFVPQEVDVVDEVSILTNIALFASSASEARNVGEMVGLGDSLGRRADSRKLSGGEYQRVALAQALCAKPTVLILDEPFNGLDHPRRLELLDYMGANRTTSNMTVLCVAHDFHLVEDRFDVVLELIRGRLYSVRQAPARRSRTDGAREALGGAT
jgi:energy-coupling factor transporter ATP-binding protein EcfA2